jgi:hypothetical protein
MERQQFQFSTLIGLSYQGKGGNNFGSSNHGRERGNYELSSS